MENSVSLLIQQVACELHLEVHASPFHAAQGLELRDQTGDTNRFLCVGYICGPQKTTIYRRIESKRDTFIRSRLWFLSGWLIKPRPRDNQYKVLKEVQTSEFSEKLFINIVKDEFGAK